MLKKFVNEAIATDFYPFIDNLIICLAPVQNPNLTIKPLANALCLKKRHFCHYTIHHFWRSKHFSVHSLRLNETSPLEKLQFILHFRCKLPIKPPILWTLFLDLSHVQLMYLTLYSKHGIQHFGYNVLYVPLYMLSSDAIFLCVGWLTFAVIRTILRMTSYIDKVRRF